jgi:hypothetical protein
MAEIDDLRTKICNSAELCHVLSELIKAPAERMLDMTRCDTQAIKDFPVVLMAKIVAYASHAAPEAGRNWDPRLPDEVDAWPGWCAALPNWADLIKPDSPLKTFESSGSNRNNRLFNFFRDDKGNQTVVLTVGARALAREFYRIKSGTSVVVPLKGGCLLDEREFLARLDDDEPPVTDLALDAHDFLSNIEAFLSLFPSSETQKNLRITAACGENDVHSYPISFVREGDKSWFLLADALGGKYKQPLELLKSVAARTGAEVHVLDANSQASHGCRLYTIDFQIELARRDENGNFALSTAELFGRGVEVEPGSGIYRARLPNSLIKYAEISAFVSLQQQGSTDDPIIHRNRKSDGSLREENLAMFHQRHRHPGSRRQDYLRLKLFSVLPRIRAQLYWNRWCNASKLRVPPELQSAYVHEVKNCLRQSAKDHVGPTVEGSEQINLALDNQAIDNWLRDHQILTA